MKNAESLVRPCIASLTPYSCARDEFMGSADVFLDANENPWGELNRYPDPYQRELKKRWSERNGIPAENIFIGNGSDEIIDICFRVFCEPGKDKAMIFTPTYGMYEVSAGINNVSLIKVPLNSNFQIDRAAVQPHLADPLLKLIFICSPNNPTGNSMKTDDIQAICSEFKGVVVLDEAYADFSTATSLLSRFSDFPRLIICRTFSKAYALAAARVGVACASADIIRYFNKVKPPYNVSRLNQEAAIQALSDEDGFLMRRNEILAERKKLEVLLPQLSIVRKVWPSDANFLLVEVEDATKVYEYLAERGIVTRNRSSLIPNCIRITTGTPEENEKLVSALKQLIL